MTNIKAIIFDLDGTAIPNAAGGMPSDRLIKAISSAKNNFTLCAATGRPLANAKAIIHALQLTDPCVISAGTQIIDPQTDEILWEANIESEDVQKILDICKPYHYEVLVKNELIGEGDKASKRIIDDHINVMYIMGAAPADAEKIMNDLEALPMVTAAGVTSWTHEGIDIHITHVGATKEHAIGELCKILRISKDDIIGVGDANNDVHLFRAVGKKVAMGNGTDLLKAHADEVIDSVDNDGLAKLIESYSSLTA
jgi:HAD superfamily hydrolase (TIGR01484 family)